MGSVGTRAWVALLAGKDADDPLVLQIKEANQSVVERFYQPSPYAHHGERVVQGQRLIQSTSDVLLGWTDISAPDGSRRDYYVRQLWNGKGSIDLEEIGPESLENTARLCAWALAHAHARTGDEVAIAAYLDEKHAFEDALWTTPVRTPTRTSWTTRRSWSATRQELCSGSRRLSSSTSAQQRHTDVPHHPAHATGRQVGGYARLFAPRRGHPLQRTSGRQG